MTGIRTSFTRELMMLLKAPPTMDTDSHIHDIAAHDEFFEFSVILLIKSSSL